MFLFFVDDTYADSTTVTRSRRTVYQVNPSLLNKIGGRTTISSDRNQGILWCIIHVTFKRVTQMFSFIPPDLYKRRHTFSIHNHRDIFFILMELSNNFLNL